MALSLFDVTQKRADLSGSQVAMTEPHSGRSVTYAQLDENAGKSAALLHELGIHTGDRIAVLCHNSIAFFELLFACGKLGAILVPLNWRMPANELKKLIADCSPAVLFFDETFSDTATQLGVKVTYPLEGESPNSLLTAREKLTPYTGRQEWPSDEIWYLLYTSGTTGTPKAVIQTYGMALVNYINASQALGLSPGDHTLNFLPLFHTAGINLYTLPALIAGGMVTVLPAFDEERVIELLTAGTMDIFFGVPAVYQLLSQHEKFMAVDLNKVRYWGCGGAPLPDALAALYQDRGLTVCNGYGMTETGPIVFLMPPENARAKIGSVGKTQLLAQARIVDEAGEILGPQSVGEMQIKGPGLTPGYWNKPDVTAQSFTDDGWLKTGDLARSDSEGFYYIVGRAKEMYISGGENVYPAEVENTLCDHPGILEAAVIGVTDEKWGEAGHAFALLSDTAQSITEASLRTYCRENLAAYKVPRDFTFVSDFPRTPSGKIQKHLLISQGDAL